MMNILDRAKEKISGVINFEYLPLNSNDNLWSKIAEKCEQKGPLFALSIDELDALKKAATLKAKNIFFSEIIGLCKTSAVGNEFRKQYCSDSFFDKENRRFSLNTIGMVFPFQGRRQESAYVYSLLNQQDDVRMKAQESIDLNPVNKSTNWENYKHSFDIPVTLGISSIGKTKFARTGLFEHIKTLDQDYITSASPREQDFVSSLSSMDKCCFIRIAMDNMITPRYVSGADGVSMSIMTEFLYAGLRYHMLSNESYSCKGEIMYRMEKVSSLELTDIIDFLINFLGVESLVVNIDEVSSGSVEVVTEVLRLFGHALCMGRRVYFIVTGIYKQSVYNAIDLSGMRHKDIFLPPLTMQECLTIFASLDLISSTEPEAQNPFFLHLLWLSGGVPRFLDYLICTIAHNCVPRKEYSGFRYEDFPVIAKFIASMGQLDVMNILKTWCDRCQHNIVTESDELVASILSLCIAETTMFTTEERQCSLTKSYYSFTIEKALLKSQMYIQSVESMTLTLPPLLLRRMQKLSAGKEAVGLITLQTEESSADGNVVMNNSRDNEELYLSVLIYRLRAASIMKRAWISLYELLGTSVGIDGQHDERIDTELWTLSKDDLPTMVQRRRHQGWNDICTRLDYKLSPLKDAFIRLKVFNCDRTVDVLIREKQSVFARPLMNVETNSKVSKTTYESDFQTERAKVSGNIADKLMVYITDCAPMAGDELFGLPKVLVITAAETDKCFGTFVTQLKKFSLTQSQIDINYNSIHEYKDPLFVIGYVDFVVLYYKQVHKKEVIIHDYPDCLKLFMYRDVSVKTFQDALNLSKIKPIFVKPCDDIKKFTGCVIRNADTKVKCRWSSLVYVSEIVNIVSEFRYFVVHHTIRTFSHYNGDIAIVPSIEIVNEMVKQMELNQEIVGGNYILDVGVLDNGVTCLVEVNQGFSFGMYEADVSVCMELMTEAHKSFISDSIVSTTSLIIAKTLHTNYKHTVYSGNKRGIREINPL